jgi:tetratricopeptide (TPR) repeat protein
VAQKTKDTEPDDDEDEVEDEVEDKPKSKAPPKGPTPVHIGGESIMDRLLPHVKKIAIGALVIAVILSGFFGYRWWRDRGRAKRTTALARAMQIAWTDVEAPDPDAKPDPTKPPATTTYASYKDRAAATAAQLDRGAGDVTSPVYKGSLLLAAGKLDEAAAAFQRSAGRKDLEGVLAREGLGYVAEAKANAATDAAQKTQLFEQAITAFRAVQPADTGLHRDYALYHEGRIYQQMERKDEAIAAYEKALEVVPETELEGSIKTRLAMLGAEQ